MKRTRINIGPREVPEVFRSLIRTADVYDSSCSREARVYYIDRDNGYFLKKAPKASLLREARMTEYFNSKGLAARVLGYISEEHDWLMTERVDGEDCTFSEYLAEPKRLCDTYAEILRSLHETDGSDCPVQNRTAEYLSTAEKGYREGLFDTSIFPGGEFTSAEKAWRFLSENSKYLKNDTLIHGDYCLPNVILKNGRFSGFIDLGNGGMGDRHIDLFWGAWTFVYNLKTDEYTERFFDAYGRDRVEKDILKIIAAAEVFG